MGVSRVRILPRLRALKVGVLVKNLLRSRALARSLARALQAKEGKLQNLVVLVAARKVLPVLCTKSREHARLRMRALSQIGNHHRPSTRVASDQNGVAPSQKKPQKEVAG